MKSVLLTNPYGPYDLEWGENQYDILESRLQRDQGPFTMKSESLEQYAYPDGPAWRDLGSNR